MDECMTTVTPATVPAEPAGDVDDLILNTLGALLAFGILKIPFLSRLITKATLSTAKKMPEKDA